MSAGESLLSSDEQLPYQSDKYKSLFDTQTLTTPSIEGAYITDGTDMDDMFD